jgi:hypothetical protein
VGKGPNRMERYPMHGETGEGQMMVLFHLRAGRRRRFDSSSGTLKS